MTADDWIAHLRLAPHPEGGYFRRSYTAELTLDAAGSERAAPGGDCDFLSAQGRPAFPPAPAEIR
jgi:predicted cupin superfamily sugar epimerase